MKLIACSTAGRLRVRNHCLRNASLLERLQTSIERWRYVLAVEINPRVGSVLIQYNASSVAKKVFEGRVVQLIERALGLIAASTRPAKLTRQTHSSTPVNSNPLSQQPLNPDARAFRKKLNRWAKRIMLVSLASSLVLVAVGSKSAHAITGIAFILALLAHLSVYRQQIFK